MIVGLGIDVASVERVRRVLERFGDRFSARILTRGEQSDLAPRTADRAEAFAGRFAAKEAAVKALGGPRDVSFHDLEVRRAPSGAPELLLHGAAAEHGKRLGVARALVSITHDAGIAAAVVVLERSAP
ncbi:MAG TPA: holo-ACP synthase [Polyangiaceae bacterium]